MNLSTLGQRITYYRKKAGLRQKDLADMLGMSPTAINGYEKNKREPNTTILTAIAKTLNVTGDALLGIEPPEFATAKNEEYTFVRTFRRLNELGRDRALEYLSVLAAAPKYANTETFQSVASKPPPKKSGRSRRCRA